LVIGRAKNSARRQFRFDPWAIRVGFEPSFGTWQHQRLKTGAI
jgi:hypothetical protein